MTAGRHDNSRPGESDRESAALPTIALVGRPNVGKSTFLARASGRFAETANAPGTTVTIERRRIRVGPDPAWLVDLPGTRSLTDRPAGEDPFWQILVETAPNAILALVDAVSLDRHLPLVLACRDLGLPVVVAVNLVDEARTRGIALDTGRLAQLLVAPVFATSGRTGEGVDACLKEAARLAARRVAVREGAAAPGSTVPSSPYPHAVEAAIALEADALRATPRSLGAAVGARTLEAGVAAGRISARGAGSIRLAELVEPERWRTAERWTRQVERRTTDRPEPPGDRLARWSTTPWPGIPAFALVTVVAFLAVMVAGGSLAAALSDAWSTTVSPLLGRVVPAVIPIPFLANAALWAVDGGLLGMLSVGLPYILTFYLLLAALEDSGYLTAGAVLVDRLLGALGLPGRAAIPLLAAAGCNVPAIYGTRVLRTRRERLLASFLVTLTPCSARSAVVVAALAPAAGVPVALAAFGVIALTTLGAGIGANALVPGRQSALVLELAPLRRPVLRHVAAKAWFRFRGFVVTATPIMLVGSLVLGLVYESGLWAAIADAIGPVTEAWLGLPAIAGVAIAFAFLRKELALQLLIVFAIAEFGRELSLGQLMTPAQLFVYAIVSSVSVPCIATLAALRAELGDRAAAAISLGSIGLALAVGGTLARVLAIA